MFPNLDPATIDARREYWRRVLADKRPPTTHYPACPCPKCAEANIRTTNVSTP